MIYRSISVLYVFLVLISGCGKKGVEEIAKPPPIPEMEKLPVDYLFVVDNSGSIPPGDAREFAKEAIKAFVELSDTNDKISIVVFDRDARLVASKVITSIESREAIKRAAEDDITFKGEYTDISSALSYVRAHKSELFRGRSSLPAVIFISDGRLQPPPQIGIDDAYQKLKENVQALSDIPFYAIGLGEKDIYTEFLPGVNGLALLKDQMSSTTGGRFYHIKSVDEIIETYFRILRFTKHISSMEGRYVFQVDESTKNISAIVLKKTSTRNICATKDIVIKDADGKAVTYANYTTMRRDVSWQTGKYYDILVIDNPAKGKWEISLRSGATPEVISLVRSLINLRYKVKGSYWDKERQQIIAWLYDEQKEGLSKAPCEIVAEIERRKIPMTKTETDVYVAELSPVLPRGDYLVQIRAENPGIYFYRMTDPIPFSVKESFFSSELPGGGLSKSIFRWKGVKFKAVVDTKAVNYPRFQATPDIILQVNKVDTKGVHRMLLSKELDRTAVGDRIIYESTLTDLKLGKYSGYFEIKGFLVSGEDVDILSQSFSFKLKRAVIDIATGALVALITLGAIVYSARPRLRGVLQIVSPSPQAIDLKSISKKSLKGDYTNVGEHVGLSAASFSIHAMRRKRKKLRVDRGPIQISNQPMGRSLMVNNGGSAELYQGDKISLSDGSMRHEMIIY